ncbi:MAG: SURF1 family protein [Nitrosomonadaceae bacterium]
MTISGWQFRVKLWPTVAATVVIIIMLMLGNWQLSRAQEKEMRQQQLDRFSQQPVISLPTTPIRLEDYQFRQIEVRGTYVPAHTIYLDNKIHRGVAGYQIITPVKLGASSMHVLINRGWVAAGRDRNQLPNVPTPSGEVIVSGIANSPTQRTLELSAETVSGRVWENLHLDRYREATGLTLQTLVILQQDDVKDGLIRQWSRPDSGAARNLGYAFQWFSMALAVLILYLVLSVKRDRSKNTQT